MKPSIVANLSPIDQRKLFLANRCRRSYRFLAANFLYIKTSIDETAPPQLSHLTFNAAQGKLQAVANRQVAEKKPIRIIVLKARHEGVTTWVQGLIFHRTIFTPNYRSMTLAHDVPTTEDIFQKSKLFYEMLPEWLQPMIRYSTKRELVFENPSDKERRINPGLRSRTDISTANNIRTARGVHLHAFHGSEVAQWPYPSEIRTSVYPAIPNHPATIIILESTAYGAGTWFHTEWESAKAGEIELQPVFLAWFDLSTYSIALVKGETITPKDNEERDLVRRYHVMPEQLKWRRQTLQLRFKSNMDDFMQEYPSNDHEAFIVAGRLRFDKQRLREMLERAEPPRAIGTVLPGRAFMETAAGCLKVWEPPTANEQYVMGVDVGGGGEAGNASVMSIIRRKNRVQVAEWWGKIDPLLLSREVELVGRWYNEALVAIEINNHGLSTQNELKQFYWNLYQWQYFDQVAHKYTKRIGWQTNTQTKNLLTDFAEYLILKGLMKVYSADLIGELMTFVRLGSETCAAASCLDDRVMAWMISLMAERMTSTLGRGSVLLESTKETMPTNVDPAWCPWIKAKDLEDAGYHGESVSADGMIVR